ncbi:hypothetical protein [Bradyrhizobium japonicum]|uniref:hypothetical protein n=1 Tax=Bradyrhizobium japonicum TaxID=375 RepID=UPI00278BD375|nr:hypothetical protein [Bradyrhizobium japonicum]
MRELGVHGVLVCCADYRCSHGMALNADCRPDDLRLSDLEPGFICRSCGRRGVDVRPDFNWNAKGPIGGMGYRSSIKDGPGHALEI